MKNTDRDRFDGRLKTASQAKQDKLTQFKQAALDPERVAKRAERQKEALIREEARKAKAALRLKEKEELALKAAEEAKLAQEQAAESKAGQAETAEQQLVRAVELEAERKAERDRRYAARRNRKR